MFAARRAGIPVGLEPAEFLPGPFGRADQGQESLFQRSAATEFLQRSLFDQSAPIDDADVRAKPLYDFQDMGCNEHG